MVTELDEDKAQRRAAQARLASQVAENEALAQREAERLAAQAEQARARTVLVDSAGNARLSTPAAEASTEEVRQRAASLRQPASPTPPPTAAAPPPAAADTAPARHGVLQRLSQAGAAGRAQLKGAGQALARGAGRLVQGLGALEAADGVLDASQGQYDDAVRKLTVGSASTLNPWVGLGARAIYEPVTDGLAQAYVKLMTGKRYEELAQGQNLPAGTASVTPPPQARGPAATPEPATRAAATAPPAPAAAPPTAVAPPRLDHPSAIAQALGRGEISETEAEAALHSLQAQAPSANDYLYGRPGRPPSSFAIGDGQGFIAGPQGVSTFGGLPVAGGHPTEGSLLAGARRRADWGEATARAVQREQQTRAALARLVSGRAGADEAGQLDANTLAQAIPLQQQAAQAQLLQQQAAQGASRQALEQQWQQTYQAYAALNEQNDPGGSQRAALQQALGPLQNRLAPKSAAKYELREVGGGFDAQGNPVPKRLVRASADENVATELEIKPLTLNPAIPAGLKRIGSSQGHPVYEDEHGRRFVDERG